MELITEFWSGRQFVVADEGRVAIRRYDSIELAKPLNGAESVQLPAHGDPHPNADDLTCIGVFPFPQRRRGHMNYVAVYASAGCPFHVVMRSAEDVRVTIGRANHGGGWDGVPTVKTMPPDEAGYRSAVLVG
jgi:hypothetical protein